MCGTDFLAPHLPVADTCNMSFVLLFITACPNIENGSPLCSLPGINFLLFLSPSVYIRIPLHSILPLPHRLPLQSPLYFEPCLLSSPGLVYLAVTMGSSSADQLSLRARRSISRTPYEYETCLFPVQRVKLYDSPELPEISGSARYPAQHDPGQRSAAVYTPPPPPYVLGYYSLSAYVLHNSSKSLR